MSVLHTAITWILTCGEKNVALLRLRNSPAVTTASTPDACTASAARYKPYGTSRVIPISTGPSSMKRSNLSITHPIASPIPIPTPIR